MPLIGLTLLLLPAWPGRCDTVTGTSSQLLAGHTAGVTTAAFSPDGARIVAVSSNVGHPISDKTARLWDAASGQQLGLPRPSPEHRLIAAAYLRDGARMFTAGIRKPFIHAWDVGSGRQVLEMNFGDVMDVYVNGALSYSLDETRIAQEIARLAGHEAAVNSAAYSPDGAHIVTASDDKTARIWDIPNWQPNPAVATPPAHCPALPSVAAPTTGKQDQPAVIIPKRGHRNGAAFPDADAV